MNEGVRQIEFDTPSRIVCCCIRRLIQTLSDCFLLPSPDAESANVVSRAETAAKQRSAAVSIAISAERIDIELNEYRI